VLERALLDGFAVDGGDGITRDAAASDGNRGRDEDGAQRRNESNHRGRQGSGFHMR
jgi:hypothetical protein